MKTGRTREQKGRTTTCKCSLISDTKREERLTGSIADPQRMETRAENLTKKERPLEMFRGKSTGKKVDRRRTTTPQPPPPTPRWSPRRRKPKQWLQQMF